MLACFALTARMSSSHRIGWRNKKVRRASLFERALGAIACLSVCRPSACRHGRNISFDDGALDDHLDDKNGRSEWRLK